MQTPFGFECKFFYSDYFRGRNIEECRLVGHEPPPHNWTVDICKTCPVPGILRANACPYMVLEGAVERTFLGLRRRMRVSAFCEKSQRVVKEPYIGCGICHPLPSEFEDKIK
jgi:hypothetical protein